MGCALVLHYIDDILIGHSDPHLVVYLFHFITFLLEQRGFIISIKSSSLPHTSIQWLGKFISASDGLPTSITISNTVDSCTSMILSLFGMATIQFTRKRLQRILGSLQWLASPGSEIGTWVAPSYALLAIQRFPRKPPWNVLAQLIMATLLTSMPAVSRKIPAPLTSPLIFVDAAPGFMAYRVGIFKLGTMALSHPTPHYVNSINCAELYACLSGIRQSILRGLTSITILTDSAAAYFNLSRGSVSSSLKVQCHVMRQIWRLVVSSGIQISIGLIPSGINPADSISRLDSEQLSIVITKAVQQAIKFYRVPKLTTFPHWVWWRSSFS